MSVIDNTILFVKQQLENAEGGHDWFHIERVYKSALLIAQNEFCNLDVHKHLVFISYSCSKSKAYFLHFF